MKMIVLSFTLLFSLSGFTKVVSNEKIFVAQALMSAFSVQKSFCQYEECKQMILDTRRAWEEAYPDQDADQVIYENLKMGLVFMPLEEEMKDALRDLYPQWIEIYLELEL